MCLGMDPKSFRLELFTGRKKCPHLVLDSANPPFPENLLKVKLLYGKQDSDVFVTCCQLCLGCKRMGK